MQGNVDLRIAFRHDCFSKAREKDQKIILSLEEVIQITETILDRERLASKLILSQKKSKEEKGKKKKKEQWQQ